MSTIGHSGRGLSYAKLVESTPKIHVHGIGARTRQNGREMIDGS
jgi:hypothetical protein